MGAGMESSLYLEATLGKWEGHHLIFRLGQVIGLAIQEGPLGRSPRCLWEGGRNTRLEAG